MDIRPLGPDDRAAAISLWQAAGLTRPWNPPEADFDRAATGTGSAVLGAVDGSVLVGTVMVGHDGHRGWIYYLAAAPARRRRGVGRALMDAAEVWLAERSIPKVQLMVRGTNTDALGFYDELGYGHEDVHVLSRWLDPEARRLVEAGR